MSRVASLGVLLIASLGTANAQNWFHAPRVLTEADAVLAIAHLNGDTATDLIGLKSGAVVPLFNDGAGAFTAGPATPLAVGSNTTWGESGAGDVDGDGRADLVLLAAPGGGAPTGFHVYFGVPGGAFAPAVYVAVATTPGRLDLADFNGDGRVDIAFLHSLPADSTGWLWHDGTQFHQSALVAIPEATSDLTAFDFTGDGLADVVVALYDTNQVQLVPTVAGQPALGATLTLPLSDVDSPGLGKGDVDGDGDLDAVLVTSQAGSDPDHLAVLLQSGGTLVAGPASTLVQNYLVFPSQGIQVGDVDGDGDGDLGLQSPFLIFGQGEMRAFVIENTTGTHFGPVHAAPVPAPGYPAGFADVDQDGNLDFVASSAIVHGDGTVDIDSNPDSVGLSGTHALLADFEGDGDVDVRAGADVYANDGTGALTYTLSQVPSAPAGFFYVFNGVAHGDFDGDGRSDLLGQKWHVGPGPLPFDDIFLEMMLFTGDGAAHYTAAGTAAPAGVKFDFAGIFVDDLDLDGDLDVWTTLGIHENGGAGFFASALPAPGGVAEDWADADLDGDVDVLAKSGSSLRFHRNHGNATFASTTLLTQTVLEPGARLLDLDGDGDLDAVTSSTTNVFPVGPMYTQRLVENAGGGAFLPPIALDPGNVDSEVYGVDDVDGDGLGDLLAASSTYDFALGTDNHSFGVINVYRRVGPGLAYAPRKAFMGRGNAEFLDVDSDGDADVLGGHLVRGLRFSNPEAGLIRQFGTGAKGSGDATPLIGAQGPAKLGSTSYELRFVRGLGGAPTLLCLGTATTDVPNAPVLGAHFYVGNLVLLVAFPLPGAPGIPAAGSFSIPSPVTPTLVGLRVVHQTLHADPGAAFGVSTSNGLEVFFGI